MPQKTSVDVITHSISRLLVTVARLPSWLLSTISFSRLLPVARPSWLLSILSVSRLLPFVGAARADVLHSCTSPLFALLTKHLQLSTPFAIDTSAGVWLLLEVGVELEQLAQLVRLLLVQGRLLLPVARLPSWLLSTISLSRLPSPVARLPSWLLSTISFSRLFSPVARLTSWLLSILSVSWLLPFVGAARAEHRHSFHT